MNERRGAEPDEPGILQEYASHFELFSGYLDFARFGPPSRDAAGCAAASVTSLARDPTGVDALIPVAVCARALAAALTGRSGADSVALIPNTSTGIFQLAFALKGGCVLVSPREFPANVYPWVQAARRGGAAIRWLRPPDGRVTPEAVSAALAPEVTALAVSAVDFRTGYRADLAALREVLGERLLLVDGIQGFGVADLPWDLADAVVSGGQKWLRAGWGSGFLSLSARALDRLGGSLSGWSGAVYADRFDGVLHEAAPSAARFSMSNPDLVAVAGLEAGLKLLASVGAARIERAVAARVEALLEVIAANGGGTLIPLSPAERAGIIPLVLPGHDPMAVGAALRAAGLTVSVRDEHVRLAPHATTRFAVADKLDAALRSLTGRQRVAPTRTDRAS
ncbi:MAG: aminotransferase class V-fold PLP-dependent enzyme [Acetobacteraceae bacterium]